MKVNGRERIDLGRSLTGNWRRDEEAMLN